MNDRDNVYDLLINGRLNNRNCLALERLLNNELVEGDREVLVNAARYLGNTGAPILRLMGLAA